MQAFVDLMNWVPASAAEFDTWVTVFMIRILFFGSLLMAFGFLMERLSPRLRRVVVALVVAGFLSVGVANAGVFTPDIWLPCPIDNIWIYIFQFCWL